jgi:hypothetical protein
MHCEVGRAVAAATAALWRLSVYCLQQNNKYLDLTALALVLLSALATTLCKNLHKIQSLAVEVERKWRPPPPQPPLQEKTNPHELTCNTRLHILSKGNKIQSKALQNPQNPQKNLTPLNPYPIHNHPKRPQKRLQVEIPARLSPPTNGLSLKRSFHTHKLYLRNNPNDNLGVEAREKLTPRIHPPTKRNEKHKKGTLLLPHQYTIKSQKLRVFLE